MEMPEGWKILRDTASRPQYEISCRNEDVEVALDLMREMAEALEDTSITIHDEFCSGEMHHTLCKQPSIMLDKFKEWK